jgi:hypothetical protein
VSYTNIKERDSLTKKCKDRDREKEIGIEIREIEYYGVGFGTHPWRRGVSTHPVSPEVVDHTRERGVPPLGYGHILQRVQEVWL